MDWFVQAVLAGVTSFIATNLDDILVLVLLFAQSSETFRPKHIVVGQYLGFTVLIALSLPGFFGGLILPKELIGLLGLIPIAIGIKHLLPSSNEKTEIQTITDRSQDHKASRSALAIITNLLTPATYQVATITIANGGDNVGVYIPLFAHSNLPSLGVILSIFFLMVSVWCLIAYQLTRQPTIARWITHYGDAIVPFVLIGLGIFILIDSRT